MKKLLFIFLVLTPIHYLNAAKTKLKLDLLGGLYRVEANPEKGFNYAFFLYIPENEDQKLNLLVIPNNAGSSKDTYDFQVESAKRQTLSWAHFAERTGSALLVPTFFRPDVDPPIYTHSLSRSSLEVKNGELKRVDLQLIKMVEAARTLVFKEKRRKLSEKMLLFGFSASAMFVNRFTFIHPDLVVAVAFGAPGGWPLAPLKEFKNKKLPYPVGIDDMPLLIGEEINLERLRRVPIYAFLGSKDDNDSVVYRDSYTEENEKLVFSLFGRTPVQRMPAAEKIYKDAGLRATFKIYAGIGHETNKDIHDDIVKFFVSILGKQ